MLERVHAQGGAVLAVRVALVRAAPVPRDAPVLRGNAQLHTDARQRAAATRDVDM